MTVLLLALIITVADQWTKQMVRGHFTLGESITIIPGFFDLTYVRNTGAAWGILGGQNLLLTLLSFVMLLLLVIFRKSFIGSARSHQIAVGLLVGGILGNLLDRMKLGYVTDFLDFFMGSYHWPAFNIADAAICTGVGLYMLCTFLSARRKSIPEMGTPVVTAESNDHVNPA